MEDHSVQDAQQGEGSAQRVPVAKGLKRAVAFVIGGLFFALGVLGAILPGIPATPFLLLASYFFVRCSPQLNERLLNSRFFGPILSDWQVRGGVQKHVKVKAICWVVIAVAVTILVSGRSWKPAVAISLAAILGIVVILRLPTIRSTTSSESL